MPGEEPGRQTARDNPLRRTGTLAEIENLATFLLSGGCDWINGETIAIDGGQALAMGGNFYALREWTDAQWKTARDAIRQQDGKDRLHRSL
jgi:hypothetical protein